MLKLLGKDEKQIKKENAEIEVRMDFSYWCHEKVILSLKVYKDVWGLNQMSKYDYDMIMS
jgi:hypothetical protein